MDYRVLDIFPVGENTSVTIEGNGKGLKNNILIKDSLGVPHRLISVAMLSGEIKKTTTLLIEGIFDSEVISL